MEVRRILAKAIIVADGDVTPVDATHLARLLDEDEHALVVAADGGALKAELLGLVPDVVVGDLDSLPTKTVARLRAAGVEVREHPRGKDASDTQLAVLEALERDADALILVAALGGQRADHGLANLLLLTLPELAGRDVVLLDGDSELRVIGSTGAARLELRGRAGDIVSLLPLTPAVEGVTTTGLEYPLDGETLAQGSSRGLSNVLTGLLAVITIRSGRLAVIHAPAPDKEIHDA